MAAPFPEANTIMGLSVSRKSTHLVDLVRLAVPLPHVGSIVAYLHIYLSSDVHANLHPSIPMGFLHLFLIYTPCIIVPVGMRLAGAVVLPGVCSCCC